MESIATEGPRNYPLVYATEPHIKLAIAYNPFDLTDISKHELVYDQTKTLADYLEGLPTEAGWTVAYEGQIIEPEAWATTKVNPFTHLIIARIPHGGNGGGKQALRIVALIAVAAFAAWAAPLLAGAAGLTGTALAIGTSVAASAITMAGGMLVNALLPATPKAQKEESATYGLDGPKNTAKEGGVIPIGYGEYRVAGNIVDFYTRNSGKDQYIFMRTALNQGEIESIEDIEINGQPLSAFENVQVRKRFGKPIEEPNDWFDEATRLINVNLHLDTEFQERTTTGEVDRLRVDVVFPYGLYSIDQDDGATKDPREVTLELQYAACDANGNVTGAWSNFPIVAQRPVSQSGSGYSTSSGATTAVMQVQTQSSDGQDYRVEGFYREVGSTTWISAGVVTGEVGWNTSSGLLNFHPTWPVISYGFQFPSAGTYEMMVTGGTVTSDGGYSITNETTQTSLLIKDKTTKAKRLTYEGGTLPRGYYKVRIRRTTPEKTVRGETVDYVYDECYVTDIGEIDTVPVNLNGIANLSICIKADDQLTSVPTLTALCKLSKVKVYDEDGTVIAERWSDNPADVTADILHNTTRGGGYPVSKTVWSKYVEWREYCEDEGLKLNGVFDTVNSLWDAMQTAARVGHGTVVPRGTKFSFAVDKAEDPVALFTPSNIYKDTFKKSWLSITDRANEIQLKFADAANGFGESTVRLADNAAFARGAKQKIATTDGWGITNIEQAMAEAEYAARQNSYIRSYVEFEAPLEAIGLTIGDVALIQHDSVDFNGGVGGRLKAGSTESVVHLDRPVTMIAGEQYSLLVFQSAVLRNTVTITNILGSRVSVSGLPNVDPNDLPRVVRIRQGGVDREIEAVRKVGASWTLMVDGAADLTNGPAELWDIDVIEERDLSALPGEHDTLTVSVPFSQAPEEYANFLFGQRQSVKLPFRLRSVSGNGIDRRTLSFIQYDERCYEKGGWDVPAVTTPGNGKIGQVRFLMADYTRTPTPTQDRIPVTLTWQKPVGTIYGGADIHIFEDDRWRLIGSVNDVTEYRADFSRGEIVRFKVVGFDAARTRARFAEAPTVTVALDVFEITLTPPSNLMSEIYWRQDAIIRLKWDAPPNADGFYQYRVQHKLLTQEQYDAWQAEADPADWSPIITGNDDYITEALAAATQADILNRDLGRYVTRVRAEKGFNASPWIYLGVNVEAADIPVPITGLTLTGGKNGPEALDDEFNGPDANWTWDDILMSGASYVDPKTNLPLVFQDYQVRIYDEDGVLLRSEYVTGSSYSYTYSKNNDDTPDEGTQKARRRFRIAVRIRGRQGQLGIPAAMEVFNPPPKIPTGIVAVADAQAMYVRWDENKEADYAGTVVWMSDEELFAPTDANRRFSGRANVARIPITEAKQWNVRVGHYDTFDSNPVNISGVYGAFVPVLAIEQLEEIVQLGQEAAEKVAAFEGSIESIGKSVLQLGLQSVADRKYTDLLARLNKERLNTVVHQEINERIEGDNAIVEVMSLIGAASPDGLSFHASGETFMVGVDEEGAPISLATKFDVIQSEIDDNLATVREEITASTGPDSAIVSQLNALAVQVDEDIAAAITEERNLRIAGDEAEATLREALAVQVGENLALFNDEVEARVSADGALLDTLALIGVKNPAGTAFSVNQGSFLLDGTQSAATVLSGIQSRFGTVEASVSNEVTARTTAVSSVATSVSNVQSQVNGMVSSISTVQSAINGVSARYGLAVQAGGYITGFVANSGADGGSFVILANNFAIVDSGGGNQRVPFIYSGGQLFLTNTTINGDLLVNGTITGNKIIGGAITDIAVSDNNSAMTGSIGGELTHHGYSYSGTGGRCLVDVYAELGTTTNAAAGTVVKVYGPTGLIGVGSIYCPGSWGGVGLSLPCMSSVSGYFSVTYTGTSGSGAHKINRTSIRVTELKK